MQAQSYWVEAAPLGTISKQNMTCYRILGESNKQPIKANTSMEQIGRSCKG